MGRDNKGKRGGERRRREALALLRDVLRAVKWVLEVVVWLLAVRQCHV